MSILLLSAVLSTACAISTPSLNDEDIQHAISMIAETFNHLTSKRGWSIQNRIEIKPILVTTLNKGKVYIVDCDLRNALLPQTSWGIHGHTTESAVEIIDTLLEE